MSAATRWGRLPASSASTESPALSTSSQPSRSPATACLAASSAASAHHPARARGTRDTYLVRLRPGESRDLTSAIGLVGAHQHLAEPGLAQVTQGADQVPVAVTDDADPHLPR